jgi:hypothetical protein
VDSLISKLIASGLPLYLVKFFHLNLLAAWLPPMVISVLIANTKSKINTFTIVGGSLIVFFVITLIFYIAGISLDSYFAIKGNTFFTELAGLFVVRCAIPAALLFCIITWFRYYRIKRKRQAA